MDRSQRRHYIAGVTVVLVFLAINVWIAIDHFRIQGRTDKETVGSLDGTRRLAEQRSALLAARPDSGPIDLEMMQKAGVEVPDSFVLGGQFTSPWGRSQILKDRKRLIWDFYDITTTGCMQLLEGAAIPGVVRAATSGAFADEKEMPMTRVMAARECRRVPLIVRLILN